MHWGETSLLHKPPHRVKVGFIEGDAPFYFNTALKSRNDRGKFPEKEEQTIATREINQSHWSKMAKHFPVNSRGKFLS